MHSVKELVTDNVCYCSKEYIIEEEARFFCKVMRESICFCRYPQDQSKDIVVKVDDLVNYYLKVNGDVVLKIQHDQRYYRQIYGEIEKMTFAYEELWLYFPSEQQAQLAFSKVDNID